MLVITLSSLIFFKMEFQQQINIEFTNNIRYIAYILTLAVHNILNFYIKKANSGVIYTKKQNKSVFLFINIVYYYYITIY